MVRWWFVVIIVFMVGCENYQSPETKFAKQGLDEMVAELEQAQDLSPPELPLSVQQELKGKHIEQNKYSVHFRKRRFNISASDIDAQQFFPSLVQGTPISVVMHPDVTGKISLSLKKVTLDEALNVVEDIYGYEIQRDGKVLRILPIGMRTETFTVNYIDIMREGSSNTSISLASEGSTTTSNSDDDSDTEGASNNFGSAQITSSSKANFWGNLQKTLLTMIGDTKDGRHVVVSPQASLVTVRAMPNELKQVKDYLASAINHMQRQVILEAKIIEVTLKDGFAQGVDWRVFSKSSDGSSEKSSFQTPTLNTISDVSNLASLAQFTIKDSNLNATISLLKTQGDVDVLSSPRVTAIHNQKAVIKVGKDINFVSGITNTIISSTTTPIETPSVSVQSQFSGISLDVTPQIDQDGSVLLHVHPSITDVTPEEIKVTVAADREIIFQTSKSEIRESDTMVRARNNEVVVIGGLMTTTSLFRALTIVSD